MIAGVAWHGKEAKTLCFRVTNNLRYYFGLFPMSQLTSAPINMFWVGSFV